MICGRLFSSYSSHSCGSSPTSLPPLRSSTTELPMTPSRRPICLKLCLFYLCFCSPIYFHSEYHYFLPMPAAQEKKEALWTWLVCYPSSLIGRYNLSILSLNISQMHPLLFVSLPPSLMWPSSFHSDLRHQPFKCAFFHPFYLPHFWAKSF